MIKAEVISHEGNVAPNWLDRCRTLATPGGISLLVILVAVGVLAVSLYRHNADQTNRASAPNTSQPAVPARPLSVEQAGQSGLQPVTASGSQLQSNTSATSITSGQTAPATNQNTPVAPTSTSPAPTDSAQKLQPQSTQNNTNGLQGLNDTVKSTVGQVQSLTSKLL